MSRDPSGAWIPELDGVRGLAILLVLMFHLRMIAPELTELGPLSGVIAAGWSGVDLFFVLCGYLNTRNLLRGADRPGGILRFMARRALRIWPLYLVLIVPYLALARPSAAEGQVPAWAYAAFVQNWFTAASYASPNLAKITWSLAIEEQFYLVWPLVVAWMPRRALAPVLALSAAVAICGRLWMAPQDIHLAYYGTVFRMDAIAAGALLALFDDLGSAKIWGRAAVFGAVAWLVGGALGAVDHTSASFLPFGFAGIAAASVAVVGAAVAAPDSLAARALRWRPLRAVGDYSYGLYMVHFLAYQFVFILHVDRAMHIPLLPRLALALAGAGVLAWLSKRLIESPALSLKGRFS